MRAVSESMLVGFEAELRRGALRRNPTLIVHGDADELVPFENAALLADALGLDPSERVVALEGAGHIFWEERPDANQLIREFLHTGRVLRHRLAASDGGG